MKLTHYQLSQTRAALERCDLMRSELTPSDVLHGRQREALLIAEAKQIALRLRQIPHSTEYTKVSTDKSEVGVRD